MSDTIVVPRTGQAPLRVRGEIIAEGSTSLNNAHPSYSGSAGRATRVKVYRTSGGKYIVALDHITQWQGEHDTSEAAVFPSGNECIEFLRDRLPGWFLQDLVEALGEHVKPIDVD